MNPTLRCSLPILPLLVLSGSAVAAPGADPTLNILSSLGQILGMMSVVLGGATLSLRGRSKKGGSACSPWPFHITLALLFASLLIFGYSSRQHWSLDQQRLQANLIRPPIEDGRSAGDGTRKNPTFSDQLTDPRGISTETLSKWIEERRPLNLIDVREREETETGMIRGATRKDYSELVRDPQLAVMQGKQAVLLSYAGDRGSELCDTLTQAGVECRFMIGGYEKWIAEDRPIDGKGKVRQALREIADYPNKEVLLDTPQVERLVAEERAQFVDVRYLADFETDHLPGAVNLPIRKMVDADSIEALRRIPKDRPVIAPCYERRSCFYSQILGLRLFRAGYDYRGRYTVPHEYMKPAKERSHVTAWKSQHQEDTLFGTLGKPLEGVMLWLVEWSGDFFVATLGLALLLRLLLLPFSVKREIDRLRAAERAPQIAALKEKLRDHPIRLQRALRAIAKEDRSTPLYNLTGSILQLTLFVLLFTVVGSVGAKYAGELWWMSSVAQPDPLFILPLLTAGSLLLHLALSTDHWGRGRSLFNLGLALLTFIVTVPLSVAVNLYLVASILLLTLHGVVVGLLFRRSTQRRTANTLPEPSPRGDYGGVVPLEALTTEDGSGEEAVRLGELMRAGLPVPAGFAVTHRILTQPELTTQDRKLIKDAWRRLGAERAEVTGFWTSESGTDQVLPPEPLITHEVALTGLFDAIDTVKQSNPLLDYANTGAILVRRALGEEYSGTLCTEHPSTSGSVMVTLKRCRVGAVSQAATESYSYGRYSRRPLFDTPPPIDLNPLLELGQRVETRLGRPQQIEWAYAKSAFQLLRSRDIPSDSRSGRSAKAIFERERFRLLQLFKDQPADKVVLTQSELAELLPRPTPLSLSLMNRLWGPGGSMDIAANELGIPFEVRENAPPYAVTVFGSLYVNAVEQQRMGKEPGMLAGFRLSRAAEAIERQLNEEFLPQFNRDIRMREAVDFRRLTVPELVTLFADWSQRFVAETYVQAALVEIAAGYFTRIAKRELAKYGENPTQYLAHAPSTIVNRALALLPKIRDKQCSIQAFLEIFGHRAPQDFELSMPRYREDLDLVSRMAERATDPTDNEDERLPLPEHALLQLAVNRARRLQSLKEEAKHHCLRDFALLRQIALELDRQLDLGGNIFYLEQEQLLRLTEGSFVNEAFNLAQQRRQESARSDEALPAQISVAQLESIGLDRALTGRKEGEAVTLRGSRVSGIGEGAGRVRVLSRPEEIDLFQEGEVLVTRSTDPTWAPLFHLASGVVTEVGGWLSHTAILARDLALPGIVGVPNATRALHTGDLVRLHEDGTVEVSQRNRRGELRYPFNREAALRWGHTFVPGRLLNISRNGLLIRVGARVLEEMQPGSVAYLILFPEEEEIECIVVRQSDDCLGLRFSEKIADELIKRLRGTTLEEEITKVRAAEGRLLKATLEVHYEEEFESLLQKILATTTSLMEAERSSLFIYDDVSDELVSVVAEGTDGRQIRFPSHLGIAGAVFTTGDQINIPDAYKDQRFNPEVDKATGYRTRSIITCPVMSIGKRPVGVIQVLNKLEGTFTGEDEAILRQYAEQAAIALHNAKHRRNGG